MPSPLLIFSRISDVSPSALLVLFIVVLISDLAKESEKADRFAKIEDSSALLFFILEVICCRLSRLVVILPLSLKELLKLVVILSIFDIVC